VCQNLVVDPLLLFIRLLRFVEQQLDPLVDVVVAVVPEEGEVVADGLPYLLAKWVLVYVLALISWSCCIWW